MIIESTYGPLQNLVSAVGALTATAAAITLGFRKRSSWEPSDQDIENGPQRVGSLLAAVGIAILWTQLRDPSHSAELSKWAVALAAASVIFLLAYGFLIGTQTYHIPPAQGGSTKRNTIGGFTLTERATKEKLEQHLTTQQVLERFNYDCDRVWPRSSRSFAKLLSVVFYLGLTVCGTIALACASILVSMLMIPGRTSNTATQSDTVHFRRTFHFRQPVFNITPSPSLTYGFTSLEHDTSLTGKVQITKITMVVQTINKSNNVFGDLWAFLGPTVIKGKQSGRIFPVGSGTWADINTYPWDLLADAPTQLKLTFGRAQPVTASYTYSVTYDFTTHAAIVEPPIEPALGYTTKSSSNDPMYLTDGLYAQLFIWTGAPRVNIDVGETKMEVEGVYVDSGSN